MYLKITVAFIRLLICQAETVLIAARTVAHQFDSQFRLRQYAA